MNYLLNFNSALSPVFLAKEDTPIKKLLLILAGVFILGIASQLSIPLEPVPLTFQSTTVILLGVAYGARYGTYVMITYLIAGICGIPVFADYSAGIFKIFGPTGGYLIGFLPAAFLSGYLAQKGFAHNVFTSFITAGIGVLVIFFFGVLVLAQFVGWMNAITFGFMPFLFSEAIKLIAVSLLIPRLRKTKPS